MCKIQLSVPNSGDETEWSQAKPSARRRTYTSFPSELAPFFVHGEQKPFKKENLRQSLARAVQTLKLTTEDLCVYKRGLVHPNQVHDGLKEDIRLIIENDKAEIGSFVYPKTCLRRETRKPAKYRSKDRSWNSKKWEEFRSISGIKQLLNIVLELTFESKDLSTLCDVWERDCCRDRNHSEKDCLEKWRDLLEFCRRDCGIADEESETSTGMDAEEEVLIPALMEDVDFFLNPNYLL